MILLYFPHRVRLKLEAFLRPVGGYCNTDTSVKWLHSACSLILTYLMPTLPNCSPLQVNSQAYDIIACHYYLTRHFPVSSHFRRAAPQIPASHTASARTSSQTRSQNVLWPQSTGPAPSLRHRDCAVYCRGPAA